MGIGRLRCPVEEKLRVLGRIHRRERERRAQPGVGADEARVDAEARERLAHVRTERIRADGRDDR